MIIVFTMIPHKSARNIFNSLHLNVANICQLFAKTYYYLSHSARFINNHKMSDPLITLR